MIGLFIWLVTTAFTLALWCLFCIVMFYVLKFALKWCLIFAPLVLIICLLKGCF